MMKIHLALFISISLFFSSTYLIFKTDIPYFSSRKVKAQKQIERLARSCKRSLSRLERHCNQVLTKPEFRAYFNEAFKSRKPGRYFVKPSFVSPFISNIILYDIRGRQFYPTRKKTYPQKPGYWLNSSGEMGFYLSMVRNGQNLGAVNFLVDLPDVARSIQVKNASLKTHPTGHLFFSPNEIDPALVDQAIKYIHAHQKKAGNLYFSKEKKSIFYTTLFPQKQYLLYFFSDNSFSLPLGSLIVLGLLAFNSCFLFYLAAKNPINLPRRMPAGKLNPNIQEELQAIEKIEADKINLSKTASAEDDRVFEYRAPKLSSLGEDLTLQGVDKKDIATEGQASDIELPSANEFEATIAKQAPPDDPTQPNKRLSEIQATEDRHREDPFLSLSQRLLQDREKWPGPKQVIATFAKRFPDYDFAQMILLVKEKKQFSPVEFWGFSKQMIERFIIDENEFLIREYLEKKKIVYIHSNTRQSQFLLKRLDFTDQNKSDKFLFIPVHSDDHLHTIICLAGVDFKSPSSKTNQEPPLAHKFK